MYEIELPSEAELLKLSEQVSKTIASRGQLLITIDSLKLEGMGLSEKMIYVLSLISLGFDEKNAISRLGIRPIEFEAWKADEKHMDIYKKALSKAEMFLEEKVLSEADSNPKMAFELLKERKREKEKKEEREEIKESNIMDMINRGMEDRGIIDAELIDDKLQ